MASCQGATASGRNGTAPHVGSCLHSLHTPGIGGHSAYSGFQKSGGAAGPSIRSTTDEIRSVAAPSSHSPSPRRKRSIRCRITCPLHPEQRLMSSSAKVWLQAAPDGRLRTNKAWIQQPAAMHQCLRQKSCPTEVQRRFINSMAR